MWCNKCGVLFYAAQEKRSACPAGGRHGSSRGAMVYALLQDVPGYQQPGWEWCSKCQGLYFGPGRQYGACSAGGMHGGAPSSDYTVLHGSTQGVDTGGATIQPDWRWCVRCQGLYYAKNPSIDRCARGGRHDGRRSGRYFMAAVR